METHWKVTWFPDDVAQRSKSTGTNEGAARRLMEEHSHEAPMLESREISDWEIVCNPTQGIIG